MGPRSIPERAPIPSRPDLESSGTVATRAQLSEGRVGDVGWLVAERPTPPGLEPFVRSLYGYIERTPTILRRREIPATMCVVIIELGPPIRVFDSGQDNDSSSFRGGFISGLDKSFTLTEYEGEQSGVQLNLTPLGARVLFGMPMKELTGRTVELGDVWPAARNLADELREMTDWDARFDRVEHMLGQRLQTPSDRTKMVAWAYARIVRSDGNVSAESLAKELGYSHKHVIDMFRDQVGVSPKALARLARFEAVARAARSKPIVSWAELAQELGFTDQAHLSREVRSFSGLTPSQLLEMFRGSDAGEP